MLHIKLEAPFAANIGRRQRLNFNSGCRQFGSLSFSFWFSFVWLSLSDWVLLVVVGRAPTARVSTATARTAQQLNYTNQFQQVSGAWAGHLSSIVVGRRLYGSLSSIFLTNKAGTHSLKPLADPTNHLLLRLHLHRLLSLYT